MKYSNRSLAKGVVCISCILDKGPENIREDFKISRMINMCGSRNILLLERKNH